MDGADLRRRGMNRIGNLIVPNDNYCKFEDWLTPILDAMLAEQKETGQVWTPSSFIRRLGKEINNEESVYYWAYKVNKYLLHDRPGPALSSLHVERHSGLLSRTHRRLPRRYDLFPFVPQSRPHRGYCTRHPKSERAITKIEESRNDHSGRWSLQAPDRECNAHCTSALILLDALAACADTSLA